MAEPLQEGRGLAGGRQHWRRRAARWSRRCPSAPRTGASATCWGGSPTPTTSTRRRWPTTARRSRSTPGFRGDPVLLAHVDALAGRGARQADDGARSADRQDRRARGRPAREGRQRGHRPDAPPARRHRARRHRRGQARRSGVAVDPRAQEGARAARRRRCWSRSCASWATRARCRRCARCAAATSGPFRFGGTDTRCMKKELPEAIKALEKKARRARTQAGRVADADDERCAWPSLRPARTCSPAWCWCSRCSSSTRSASCSRCRC